MVHFPPRVYEDFIPYANAVTRIAHPILKVEGAEHIPGEGAAVVAANHLRFTDSVIIPAVIANEADRRITFGAKSEYFDGTIEGPKPYRDLLQWFFAEADTDQARVYRDSPRAYQLLEAELGKRLQDGKLVGLHPEGTRSPDGRMYRFERGAARLALQHGVQLNPVGLSYGPGVFGLFRSARIAFGEPIMPEEFSGMNVADLNILLEQRVQRLTGQEFVNLSARAVKAELTQRRVAEAKREPRQ